MPVYCVHFDVTRRYHVHVRVDDNVDTAEAAELLQDRTNEDGFDSLFPDAELCDYIDEEAEVADVWVPFNEVSHFHNLLDLRTPRNMAMRPEDV